MCKRKANRSDETVTEISTTTLWQSAKEMYKTRVNAASRRWMAKEKIYFLSVRSAEEQQPSYLHCERQTAGAHIISREFTKTNVKSAQRGSSWDDYQWGMSTAVARTSSWQTPITFKQITITFTEALLYNLTSMLHSLTHSILPCR